ncbi:unnamed protein product [Vicia faba]|uniref:Uncharacterized protein n=1 Tax=Vicia faba TaxID=3906 RepID=A0AAV0ZUV6_VICFA|nr:unnamed protein product [Vicia faba]
MTDCFTVLSCENRFNIVTICLNKELSNFTSWSIQAFVFEVEDRERISGSAYGGQQDICCTNDLPKLTVCNDGQGCHRPSPMNSNWPEVYGVAFYHAQEINTNANVSLQCLEELFLEEERDFDEHEDSQRDETLIHPKF